MALPLPLDWSFQTTEPPGKVVNRASAAISTWQRYKVSVQTDSMVTGVRIVRQWWWWVILWFLIVITAGLFALVAFVIPRKTESVTITAYANGDNPALTDVTVNGHGSIQAKNALKALTSEFSVSSN